MYLNFDIEKGVSVLLTDISSENKKLTGVPFSFFFNKVDMSYISLDEI